jgi:hypothetical protein
MDKNYFNKIILNDSNFKFKEIIGTNKLTKTFIVTDITNKKNYFYKQIQNKTIIEFNLINKLILELNKKDYDFKTPELLFYIFDTNFNICHQIYEYIEIDNKFNSKSQTSLINENMYIEKSLNLIKDFNQISKTISKSLIQNFNLDNIKINNLIKTKLVGIPKNLLTIFNEELNYDYSSSYLIINDINPSNFLTYNSTLYLIDFDDIKIGVFEFDLSKFYINLYFENSSTNESFIKFSKIIKTLKFDTIKYQRLINAIILNLVEKISMDYLRMKTLNQNLLNRLIEIKTNKQKYLDILIGVNI